MSALAEPGAEHLPAAPQGAEARVCALLIERGRLKQEDLVRAERLLAEAPEGRLTPLLARLGLVSERDLAEAWSRSLHLPLLGTGEAPAAPPEVDLSVRFMKQYHVVPVAETEASSPRALQDEQGLSRQSCLGVAHADRGSARARGRNGQG